VSAAKRVLVIEDGLEYTRALERIAEGRAELVRAGDADEASRALDGGGFHAVLLDVVFDRIPEESLVGDRSRGTDHLVRYQGFYIADALAPQLADVTRIVMAFDFSADPERLEMLRRRLPGLEGIREGTGLDDVLARLLQE
jgi:DNA-binding NtrC family response regulator